jgi:hypothetical protein
VALEAQKKKEVEERKKFCLEQSVVANVSRYCTTRIAQRLQAGTTTRVLDFGPDGEPQREAESDQCRSAAPESNRPAGGPEQPRITGPEQPRQAAPPNREVDPVTNLLLFSTPMDNVVAAHATVDQLAATGADALQISYVKALVTKAVEQPQAQCDSQGQMHSCSTMSRAASSAACHAITVANNGPDLCQRQVVPAHSTTNQSRPQHQQVAANGQPIDARTHVNNVRQWRSQQSHDLRHTLNHNRVNDDGSHQVGAPLSRVRTACFEPMVRGKRYPIPFRAPKEIEKYEPLLDPSVWIDLYPMVLGIVGHTDLLVARYLPLMMDGDTRQWVNILEPNNIDSWEEMRAAFVN